MLAACEPRDNFALGAIDGGTCRLFRAHARAPGAISLGLSGSVLDHRGEIESGGVSSSCRMSVIVAAVEREQMASGNRLQAVASGEEQA